MEGLDHLEHLDKHLVDELAQVARETVREELREQTRKQRRTAMLYAASGAVALYAGAALALTVGLALAIGLPDWAAALITAAILGVVAYVLRGAARPSASRPTPEREAELAAMQGDPAAGRASGIPAVPPVPPVAPGAGLPGPGGGVPGPGAGAPVPGSAAPGSGTAEPAPGPEGVDPEQPHHRA
ncbi:phage holin family protein [Streptomyces sp. NPDC057257]|uniref:phage holin family protein n=1 Tax=Streptomyces sp. NPDC057257 TaxID=3346071 RepID=UPI003644E1AC